MGVEKAGLENAGTNARGGNAGFGYLIITPDEFLILYVDVDDFCIPCAWLIFWMILYIIAVKERISVLNFFRHRSHAWLYNLMQRSKHDNSVLLCRDVAAMHRCLLFNPLTGRDVSWLHLAIQV